MVSLPSTPAGLTVEEWQRAVALLAATTLHAEKGSTAAFIARGEVVETAKRFTQFLRDGR